MYKIINKIFDRLLRLPKFAVYIPLALSFIFSSIFNSMQAAAAASPLLGVNINIYVAVFVFGIVFWLLFEAVIAVYFYIIKSMMGPAEIQKNRTCMMNILRWLFIVLNLISGALRMLYFNYPLALMLIENVLIFSLNLGILILYYFFIRKKYIAPQLYPRSLMAFCAPYLLFLFLTMILNLSGAFLA